MGRYGRRRALSRARRARHRRARRAGQGTEGGAAAAAAGVGGLWRATGQWEEEGRHLVVSEQHDVVAGGELRLDLLDPLEAARHGLRPVHQPSDEVAAHRVVVERLADGLVIPARRTRRGLAPLHSWPPPLQAREGAAPGAAETRPQEPKQAGRTPHGRAGRAEARRLVTRWRTARMRMGRRSTSAPGSGGYRAPARTSPRHVQPS
jgi:hypothetical protein